MSTATRVVKNTGFLYLKMGISMFISLWTTRLILNSLGASDFGIYNVVGGAIAMLGFLNNAMATSTQRFMSYTKGEGNANKMRTVFTISIVLHLIVAFLAVLVFLLGYYIYFHGLLNIPAERIPSAKLVYICMIGSTVFTIMTVPYDAILNAHENMKIYALIGLAESFMKLGVAFACVVSNNDKLLLYAILMSVIPFISMGAMRIYCHRYYDECKFSLEKYWNRSLMKEMTVFAGWSLGICLSSMFRQFGMGIILNFFFGTLANAAQGVVNQLNGQLSTLGNGIIKALNPVITKSAGSEEYENMLKAAVSGTKVSFFIITFVFIPFIVDTEYILKLWLYKVPRYSDIFCILLLITTMVGNITLFIPQMINAVGKIKEYSFFISICNFLPLVLAVWAYMLHATPEYMYYALMISMIFKIIIDLYYGHKYCGLNPRKYFREVILTYTMNILLSIYISSLVKGYFPPSLMRFVLISIIGISAYALFAYILILNQEERMTIKKIIFSIRLKFKKQYKTS